jgi:two-component system, NtrC family, sensor kinase
VAAGVAPSPSSLATLGQVEEHLTLHARNLLNLGRPAPTHTAPETDLRDVVSDLISGLSQAGILRRVQVQLEIPPQRRLVRVSRAEIERILINLVKNAVEALEDAAPANPRVRISIGGQPASGTATCAVSDNGAGIPAARLPLLFEPYYTTKLPHQGTGLGLFVVKQIAQRAGGDVVVESEPGRLTTFTVTLPLAEQKSDGHAEHAVPT